VVRVDRCTIDVVGWNVAATGTWAYGYNPDGLRASKTPPAGSGIGATTFTWDRASGLPMLLAQDQAGVGATYFIYGPGGLPVEQINPDGTTLWLHHDQIGSTRTATDNAGAAVATWSYDPYGNQAAHTGTIDVPLGYTGQYTDPETGLQYLRARYYDPATGQFISRDPLNAVTREAYGYVGGNPLNMVDPTGLWAWDGFCVVRFNCNESAKNAVGVCFRGVSCLHGEKSLADTYSWARDVRSTAMAVLGAEEVAACALMWSACAPLLIAANAIGPTVVLAYGVARAVWHELHGECDPHDTGMISSGLNGPGVPTGQDVSPQAPLHWSPQPGQNNLTVDRGVPYPNPVPQNGRSNVRPGGVR
jgi:RHS repeat-associated protein